MPLKKGFKAMTAQLDLFRETPEPLPDIIQDNALVLVSPTLRPFTEAEALERKAARLREIADRKAAKTFEDILNGGTTAPRGWGGAV